MQGVHVRGPDHFLERRVEWSESLDPFVHRKHHLHSECPSECGNRLADRALAVNTEALAVQIENRFPEKTKLPRETPLSGLYILPVAYQVPAKRENQGKRVFRDGVYSIVAYVADRNPAFPVKFQIDVIQASRGYGNQPQVIRAIQIFTAEANLVDYQHGCARHSFGYLPGRGVVMVCPFMGKFRRPDIDVRCDSGAIENYDIFHILFPTFGPKRPASYCWNPVYHNTCQGTPHLVLVLNHCEVASSIRVAIRLSA